MDSPTSMSAPFGEPQRLIAGGESAQLFDLGNGYVLKLFREGVSDEMIARESDASSYAEDCGVPTAAAVASVKVV